MTRSVNGVPPSADPSATRAWRSQRAMRLRCSSLERASRLSQRAALRSEGRRISDLQVLDVALTLCADRNGSQSVTLLFSFFSVFFGFVFAISGCLIGTSGRLKAFAVSWIVSHSARLAWGIFFVFFGVKTSGL